MKHGIKALAALAGALLMAAPAVAQEASPAGMWQTGPGDVRLEFQLCGKEGQELCGWLRYARDESPRVQRYLNQPVVEQAERVGQRTWKGAIILAGHRMYGTMALAEENRFVVDGCVALIICGEFNLYRKD
jgi:uncharacterized protein (DUF2147 family)